MNQILTRSFIRRRLISSDIFNVITFTSSTKCSTRRHAPLLFSSWSVDSSTGVVSKKGISDEYQAVIGLEIHAQLDIPTKLFSGASTQTTIRTKPNSNVWPFDLGVPGFLPRLSQEAVQAAILTSAATKCDIQHTSRFERKHYFYADSPLGYQVTQQRWPIAKDGVLICYRSKHQKKKGKKKNGSGDKDTFEVRIERIQLEQDTGKTTMVSREGITQSMVDFNRAGSALVEIVFHPDLRSPNDAAVAVETLRQLLKHIGTCNGKMEEGSLRCDLNVSVAPIVDGDDNDDDFLSLCGNRVEVKNLNSIRQVQLAAEYEAIRQVKSLVDDDKPTSQETRTFEVKSNKTVVIRSKEGAKDYRFMPEPDLPPLILNEKVSFSSFFCLLIARYKTNPKYKLDYRHLEEGLRIWKHFWRVSCQNYQKMHGNDCRMIMACRIIWQM